MSLDELPKGLETFPKDFIWATSTAAYQIEGATHESGRGLSVWDEIRKIPGRINDNSPADLSCEGFHKFREDIQLIKNLGVSHHRFSVSWSRIFPNGLRESASQAGIQFYRDFCKELLRNDIQPIVTLFHHDYPLDLYNKGGWLNPDSVHWFVDFADFCMEHLGEFVKMWVTFNEIMFNAIASTVRLENVNDFSLDADLKPWKLTKRQVPYLVAHRQILAHGHTFKRFTDKYRPKFGGQMGIVAGGRTAVPANPEKPEDVEAAANAFIWHFRWVNDPIFTGNYPEKMRAVLKTRAKQEGLAEILPEFTSEEKALLKNSADFLGINYYVLLTVGEMRPEIAKSVIKLDAAYDDYPSKAEKICGNTWITHSPEGINILLDQILGIYGKIQLMISENGCMDYMPAVENPLDDPHRVRYLKEHIEAVAEALKKGHNVTAYTVWTLYDNFEWQDGFEYKFGLHRIDFDSAEKTRLPKRSASFFKAVVAAARH